VACNWKTETVREGENPSRWIHAKHVDYLDAILIQLFAGELLKEGYIGVVIEEPPRHGKSELCSHYAPAWYLGAFPDNRVMLASYEADFAATWGRKTRDTIEQHGKRFFGIEVNPRTSAADNWNVKGHKGGMFTAGVGGALTGKGANLLIVDDPVKNMKDAQSETMRRNQWEWYKSTFRTRLEPDGVILLIGTRWHEDDLIGRVLAEAEVGEDLDDKFIRVRLPAIAEEPDEEYPMKDPLGRVAGEVLFPERFPYEKLVPHMSNANVWSALYQQRPAPSEGGVFEKDWFEVVPMVPRGVRIRKSFRRWDLAATDPKAGEDPDWSVGLLLGLGDDDFIYIMDMVRIRENPGNLLKTLRRTVVSDGFKVRNRVEREPGSQGKIAVWQLARTVFKGYNFRGIPSTGPKELRIDTVAGAAERGEFKVIRGKWNRDFFYEVTHYPFAAHDDICDALSGGYEDFTKRRNVMATA
jgi:predicted phage terminase large subunit-like protein